MPPKKNQRKRFIKILIFISVAIALAGIAYLVFLWWEYRRLSIVYKEFGIPVPAQYDIHGIDVSRYQERISWESVKNMNIQGVQLGFAFIKATEGVQKVDPFFKRNWKKSKQAGMIRGAYHFFIASKDGKIQAQNFIESVTLESGDLPPVLDVEKTFRVSSSRLRKEVKAWLDVVEQYYLVKPIIYTGADFYAQYLNGYFDEYPLWVAHYLQPDQPRIGRDWSFWQHSEKGRVNGIYTRVDFNVFNGDSALFKALLVP